ncbi:protein-disulfide reductase DsbD domain-containing protein [Aureimonas sp. ME7]|uniref:protein-disulfide reductase DsbD domain-containing protein n=1 Tax=Aureimonas sp. ME7 TaxID=2744252 RepID=UPI0015F601BB|nr:protein-disulfide reductase DsbD domain-containing protein [Aureimonas sp. ME7]
MSIGFCTSLRAEAVSRLLLACGLAFAAFPAQAITPADQNAELRSDGATLRLVALKGDADGMVRGALSIELAPGWKTYWTAPGPVGLAPRIDLSESTGIEDPVLQYPIPARFAEGDAESVGYAEPMAVFFEAKAIEAMPRIEADILIGVCREICVPLAARLSVFPSEGLSDRALVLSAKEALPAEAGSLAPRSVRWSQDLSGLEVGSLAGVTDAFIDASPGWSFGPPIPTSTPTGPSFTIPVLARPSGSQVPMHVSILLIAAEKAQLSRSVQVDPPDSPGRDR